MSRPKRTAGGAPERQIATDLCPGDDARLEHHLGSLSKVLGLPKDKIREGSNRDAADVGRDAMHYRRIDRVLRDVAFHAAVINARLIA